jgi:2-polyprenyl-3-methyl-5-hydroxy-6-metoxy-1,4-benzoquinol methylase
MPTDYLVEQQFFDRVAARTEPKPIQEKILQRYAAPRWPHLFSKEKMFTLAGQLQGKRLLEVGCGEGVVSVQLAHCGAQVTGVDISPTSIEVARRRAALQGVDARFDVMNVVEEKSLGEGCYDVIWCDLILHHLVDSLDKVMGRIRHALRPGGIFIAREPLAYAAWLRALRSLVPVHLEVTPDEQPFRESEFDVVRKYFPNLKRCHYRLLARLDRVTENLGTLRWLARVDRAMLTLPGFHSLAGTAVMWATR